MRSWKILLPVAVALLMAACGGERPAAISDQVHIQTVVKEVQRPCPVTRPARPAPLARPLPDSPRVLIDVLASKLEEWAGPGKYGDQADAALATCTAP